MNKAGQYIVLLHGPGGTGKSHVIKHVITYAKQFMTNMNCIFDKRTIVVTALTGSAAVSIRGETTHSAACLNNRKIPESKIAEYKGTYMFICDEISFAGQSLPKKLNSNLNRFMEKDNLHGKYGGLPMVFAGDFTQLKPVNQYPLYLVDSVVTEFHIYIHTMMELRTNHRFKNDDNSNLTLYATP